MQTIYLDISNKGVVPTVYAKQKEVGRKFAVILTDSGLPYIPEVGSVFSVWYKGASGEGNYTDIGDKPAFSLNGNKVEVEMIVQMLSTHGDGILCLTLNSPNGNQISSWNIPYLCEIVPGAESENAKDYYTAFSKAVEELPFPDETLSISGRSADAAATGAALSKKAPAGYGLGKIKSDKYLTDWADAKETGLYNVSNGISPSGVGGWVWVESFDDNNKSYTFSDDRYGANCMQTTMVNGVMQPWDWVNPPMDGVEYRTTERFAEKPVYMKSVNIGMLPDSTTNYARNTIPIGASVFSILGYGEASDGEVQPLASLCDEVWVNKQAGYIGVKTSTDRTKFGAVVIVKYIKD